MSNKKLPKGVKMSLVQTQGLKSGDYPLYNLVGLSAGKVQCILDALTDKAANGSVLAKEIVAVIPSFSLFGPL